MSYMQEANNNLNTVKAEIQEGIERAGWTIEDTNALFGGLAELSVRVKAVAEAVPGLTSGANKEETIRRAGRNGGLSRVSFRRADQLLGVAMGEGNEARPPQLETAHQKLLHTADAVPPYFDRKMNGVLENIQKIGGLAAQLMELTIDTDATLYGLREAMIDASDRAPAAVEAVEAYQDAAGWPKG